MTDPNFAADWIARSRAAIAGHDISDHQRNLITAHLDFCGPRGLIMCDPADRVDLWGFGEATPLFGLPDGTGWWTCLTDLIAPSGLDYMALEDAYRAEEAMGYGDTAPLVYTNSDGDQWSRLILKNSAVLRIMFFRSVWAAEMQKNLFPAFRRGVAESGLGDALGPVTVVDAEGSTTQTTKTFSEFLAGGDLLPSADEVRAQAFAGPAGALPREDS